MFPTFEEENYFSAHATLCKVDLSRKFETIHFVKTYQSKKNSSIAIFIWKIIFTRIIGHGRPSQIDNVQC